MESSSNKIRYIIVVPYRNRKKHLETFLYRYSGVLSTRSDVHIVIASQQKNDGLPFNRGGIKNAGLIWAMNNISGVSPETIVMFHDVDTIPSFALIEDNTSDFWTDPGPNQVYALFTHPNTLGGICSARLDTWSRSQGFPNRIWKWGFEDNILKNRIESIGASIQFGRVVDAMTFTCEEGDVITQRTGEHQKRDISMVGLILYTIHKNLPSEDVIQYSYKEGLRTCNVNFLNSFDVYNKKCTRVEIDVSPLNTPIPMIHQKHEILHETIVKKGYIPGRLRHVLDRKRRVINQ